MTIDNRGNVYLTGKTVTVYNRRGEKIAEIPVPEGPANVTFGGTDNQTLFITARTSLYSIPTEVRGARTPVRPGQQREAAKAGSERDRNRLDGWTCDRLRTMPPRRSDPAGRARG